MVTCTHEETQRAESVDTVAGSLVRDAGMHETAATKRRAITSITMTVLRRGRRRALATASVLQTRQGTCSGLRKWQRRSEFRAVGRLTGGGIGNTCNTAPGEGVVISGTPKQERLL